MEFTEKVLVDYLKVSQPALFKALKATPFELKEVENSSKKVKHYQLKDLPQRYQDKLKEQGIKAEEKVGQTTNISKATFTQKYLLATPVKQKLAILKCKLIEFYMKRDDSLNVQKWLELTLKNSLEFDELGHVSVKQLYDWYKKYRDAKAKGTNVVEAFIDSRGAKKGVKALNEEQKETAERYFLKSNKPVMREVYRNMCHSFGDSMPSYDVLNNYYKEWKKLNPLLYEFSKSPDSAKNKYLVAYGNMSAKAKYRNHYWELDSTPADVICSDGKRYAIIAALDIHTRRVIFHLSETSSAYSISQLLRKAILKLGIPENVVIDNGKDYTSNHFESMCLNLGINMVIVPPFSGECKPHVERVFGTLSRELFEQIPGYIGHNVAQRSEIQARKSFSEKIKSQEKWREEQKLKSDEEKKAWRDAWKLKKENIGLELNLALSADELAGWIDKWNEKMYEQRVHTGIKTSPINKWNSCNSIVKSIPDHRMLDLLLGESVIRRVGKKGIAFDGCQYAHLELIEYTGQHVHIMAPEDMGFVLVYNSKMEFICIAEDLEHMGESRYQVRKARKKSLTLMRKLDAIVKEAESVDDITIRDRIEDISDVVESKTPTVVKHTEAVDRLIRDSKTIEAKDHVALEDSNRYDFSQKDEEDMPIKLLPSGRPPFKSFYERFLWALENDQWNEKDEALKEKNLAVYELAYKDYMRRKSS